MSFPVPLVSVYGQRDPLDRWAERKTTEQLAEFWATRNARSIGGLPAR